jgi:hypothetical protein
LLGRCVIRVDSFELLLVFGRPSGNGGDFMHQKIRTPRMFDQVCIKRGVAGQERCAAAIIDSIPKRWQLLAAMIDLEGGDSDVVLFNNAAFADLLRDQFYAINGITFAAYSDIDMKSPWQPLHHLLCVHRAPYAQWRAPITPRTADPSGEPKIGKTDNVIGMMVGQEKAGDFAEWDPQLVQPLHRAAPGIEDEFFSPHFHERARAEAFEAWRRCAGTEQGYAKNVFWIGHWPIPFTAPPAMT